MQSSASKPEGLSVEDSTRFPSMMYYNPEKLVWTRFNAPLMYTTGNDAGTTCSYHTYESGADISLYTRKPARETCPMHFVAHVCAFD